MNNSELKALMERRLVDRLMEAVRATPEELLPADLTTQEIFTRLEVAVRRLRLVDRAYDDLAERLDLSQLVRGRVTYQSD